jgi:hypothetical protein
MIKEYRGILLQKMRINGMDRYIWGGFLMSEAWEPCTKVGFVNPYEEAVFNYIKTGNTRE